MDRARDSPDSRIPCNNSDSNAARVLEEHLTTTNPSPLGVMYTLHPQCHIPEATCLPINSTYPFFNCHAHSFVRPFVRSLAYPASYNSTVPSQHHAPSRASHPPPRPIPRRAALSLTPAHPSYPGSAPVTSDHLPPSLPPAQRIIQQESTSRGHPPNLPCHPRQAHQLAKHEPILPQSLTMAQGRPGPRPARPVFSSQHGPDAHHHPPPPLSRHAECKASLPIGPCPSRAAPSESCLATHTAFIEACEWPSGRIRGTSCRDATVRGLNENHLRRSRYSLMPKGRFS